MYNTDVQRMVEVSAKKVAYLEGSPLGYAILAALAGVYLGFGITLIFSVGAP
ncbi:MAG: nitrite transporter NirC, partial [Nitrospirae bacterium]|nr:nitrite transporter NirC [Nitrospirota bacterium]